MDSNMPEDKGFDQTLNVLKEGYDFVMSRNKALGSDVFETRILGEKTICLTGSRAAELFYDHTRFRRSDAAPKRVEKTLFGEGGVQGLDGEAHRHRKTMFMGLMGPDEMTEIGNMTKKYWKEYFEKRDPDEPVELYEAAKIVFLNVACEWAGVSLLGEDVEARAAEISDLYESPAALGLQHWRGRRSRSKDEE